MPAKNDLNYTIEELLLADFGRAIAHPTRSRMFLDLLKNQSFRNVDFSSDNNISISTTHGHIYKLKEGDLINLEYTNHEYHITLNRSSLEVFKQLLNLSLQDSENEFPMIHRLNGMNKD